MPNLYIHHIKMYLFNQSKLLHESPETQVKKRNVRSIFRLSKVIQSKYDILQNSLIWHTSNRQKSENIKI